MLNTELVPATSNRVLRATTVRLETTITDALVPAPAQVDNGDEARGHLGLVGRCAPEVGTRVDVAWTADMRVEAIVRCARRRSWLRGQRHVATGVYPRACSPTICQPPSWLTHTFLD